MRFLITIAVASILLLPGCSSLTPKTSHRDTVRPAMWINAMQGEPMSFEAVLDELQQARVIYLGEHHRISRHHDLQNAILSGLAERGVKLVLAMEQFEFMAQPALDRFNQQETDLNQLVTESNWAKRWGGHTNYHALLKTAKENRIPVLALNARAETIRAVGRNSLNGITHVQRAELPMEIVTEDVIYERLMNRLLSVHMAFDPDKLRPIFEAQVARDETMANRLNDFLNSPSGQGRTAIVICGRGHCEFGLGMPARVARRMPETTQRIVLFSESGDLYLTDKERKQAREIEVPHQFLRDLGKSAGDFFHVIEASDPKQ